MSSANLVDQRLRRWTPAALEPFGLARHARLFGDGLEPLTIAGAVTERAAAETGLAAGTPVSAGYADGPAMALGLGATDESLISVIAGTWGLNQLATRSPATDGSVAAVIAGPRPGEFVVTDAGPTSASAFEWFVDSIIGRADMSRRGREALFDFCNEEVLRAPADGDVPYFLPYLNGRLEQPEARACFIGLASWHGLPEMVRAVYEGVAFEHRGHIDHLLDRPGKAARRALRRRGGPQPSVARHLRVRHRPAARTLLRRRTRRAGGGDRRFGRGRASSRPRDRGRGDDRREQTHRARSRPVANPDAPPRRVQRVARGPERPAGRRFDAGPARLTEIKSCRLLG